MKQNKFTPEEKRPLHSTSSSKKYKIICTPTFLSEARKLLKKYPNFKSDCLKLRDQLKKDPITEHEALGNDLYKVRMPISDKQRGQSGGARLIIQVKVIDKCVYVLTVYDKGKLEAITDKAIQKILKGLGLSK